MIEIGEFELAQEYLSEHSLGSEEMHTIYTARLLVEQKEYPEARKKLDNLIDEELNEFIKFGLYLHLALVYTQEGKTEKTQKFIDLAEASMRLISDLGYEFVYDWMSIHYSTKGYHLQDVGKFDMAFEAHTQALNHRQTRNNHLRISESLNAIGNIKLITDDLENCLKYYNQALNTIKLIERTNERVDNVKNVITGNIGLLRLRRGEIEEAEIPLLEVLAYNKKKGIESQIIRNFQNLASLNTMRGDMEKSRYYFNETINLAQKNNDSKVLAGALYGLGNNYYLTGELEKSLDYYTQARLNAEKVELNLLVVYAITGIGVIHTLRNSYETAIQLFDELSVYQTKVDYPHMMARPNYFLSIIYMARKQHHKAIEYAELSLEEYRKMNNDTWVTSGLTNLVQIYTSLKNLDSAKKIIGRMEKIYVKDKDNLFLSLNYKLAKGLVYKLQGEDSDILKAIEYFKEVIKHSHQFHTSAIVAMFNLSEIYLTQIFEKNEIQKLPVVADMIQNLMDTGRENNRHGVYIDGLILRSKLSLVIFELVEASNYMRTAFEYIEDYGLNELLENVEIEYAKLVSGESKWLKLKGENAPIQDRIIASEILEFTQTTGGSRGSIPS